MKIDWSKYIGQMLNITMNENYGVVFGKKESDQPQFYEIVFKTGKLTEAFEDGLLLEAVRDEHVVKIYVPLVSIKCVEIFDINE
ncbi:MAG: hypothetical protein JEY94_00275 [Melioribacteraceae bacterium]|nr:hypothetical protein [Melioribacteraceae bacterium]